MSLAVLGATLLFFAGSTDARGRKGCSGGSGGHGGHGCSTGGCSTGGCSTGFCGTGYGGAGYAPQGCGVPYMAPAGGGMRMGMAPGSGDYVAVAAPANLMITLPADARLLVDGYETKSTSDQRLLVTPDLEPGREYRYTLTAEAPREGGMQRVTRTVTVRAGEQTSVLIQFPETVASR